jgi:hypothetical protein
LDRCCLYYQAPSIPLIWSQPTSLPFFLRIVTCPRAASVWHRPAIRRCSRAPPSGYAPRSRASLIAVVRRDCHRLDLAVALDQAGRSPCRPRLPFRAALNMVSSHSMLPSNSSRSCSTGRNGPAATDKSTPGCKIGRAAKAPPVVTTRPSRNRSSSRCFVASARRTEDHTEIQLNADHSFGFLGARLPANRTVHSAIRTTFHRQILTDLVQSNLGITII